MIVNHCAIIIFQTPYYWPSKSWAPENTDYAVYLCKRAMQNKSRLELADYEAENLQRLQKMFSRKWDYIFMQAEAQNKWVTKSCFWSMLHVPSMCLPSHNIRHIKRVKNVDRSTDLRIDFEITGWTRSETSQSARYWTHRSAPSGTCSDRLRVASTRRSWTWGRSCVTLQLTSSIPTTPGK